MSCISILLDLYKTENEIDSLPNGSGPKVFERLANNVADDIKEVLLYHLNSRKLENERV